ncbi:hypothetical protein EMCRGX_G012184 [Ephydatia muelleri]
MMAKPVLLPEPFSGDAADWNEWLSHFESVAVVNKWETGGEKLKWLRVRLTGKAQTAFMKLPDAARDDYGRTQTSRTKARERLALNQFLSQIDNPQVAFGVKQKRPGNIDEAVAATLELESYLKASGVGMDWPDDCGGQWEQAVDKWLQSNTNISEKNFPAAQLTSSRDDNSQSATTVQQPVGQPTITDELLDDDDEQPTDNDVQDEDGPAPVPDPRRYPTRDRRIPERYGPYLQH